MGEEKTFMQRALDNMKEDAAKQHEIDKANFEAVKADSKARFQEATAPNPDVEEFVQAKGFKAKLGVLLKHAERNAKNLREDDRKKYEATLQEMRNNMNALTEKDKEV